MYQIRFAVDNDYDKLCPIFKEIHQLHVEQLGNYFNDVDNPFPHNYFKHLIKDDNTSFLIIENDENIMGYAVMVIRETKNLSILVKRKFAYLDDFAIDSKYQKQGLGSALFSECVRIAKVNDVSVLELNVWEFNQNAITFYENLGMKTLNRKMFLNI